MEHFKTGLVRNIAMNVDLGLLFLAYPVNSTEHAERRLNGFIFIMPDQESRLSFSY
jgi:hypothetical protein